MEMLEKVGVRSADGEKELGEVSVSVAGPERSHSTLVLAHGAGGAMNTQLLVDLEKRLVERSLTVVRFNFLYSENKKRAPDRRPHLEACWLSVADWVTRELAPEELFVGGKSMGGRMASYLVSDGYPCRGIFFLGYPLHSPGKVEQLRKDHLRSIKVPMLFIQGTRDSLCNLDLLKPILEQIGPRVALHVVDGGDHSFKVPKRIRRHQEEITDEIAGALADWIEKC